MRIICDWFGWVALSPEMLYPSDKWYSISYIFWAFALLFTFCCCIGLFGTKLTHSEDRFCMFSLRPTTVHRFAIHEVDSDVPYVARSTDLISLWLDFAEKKIEVLYKHPVRLAVTWPATRTLTQLALFLDTLLSQAFLVFSFQLGIDLGTLWGFIAVHFCLHCALAWCCMGRTLHEPTGRLGSILTCSVSASSLGSLRFCWTVRQANFMLLQAVFTHLLGCESVLDGSLILCFVLVIVSGLGVSGKLVLLGSSWSCELGWPALNSRCFSSWRVSDLGALRWSALLKDDSDMMAKVIVNTEVQKDCQWFCFGFVILEGSSSFCLLLYLLGVVSPLLRHLWTVHRHQFEVGWRSSMTTMKYWVLHHRNSFCRW